MTNKRNLLIGAGLLVAIVTLGYGQWLIEPAADAAGPPRLGQTDGSVQQFV